MNNVVMILNKNVVKSLIFITVYIMSFSCANAPNKSKTESPNYCFLVDDQGWNGTSVQMMNKEPLSKSDYHETPNLEILAQNGIKVFQYAYSSTPVCTHQDIVFQFGKSPARMSLIRVGMNTDHY